MEFKVTINGLYAYTQKLEELEFTIPTNIGINQLIDEFTQKIKQIAICTIGTITTKHEAKTIPW